MSSNERIDFAWPESLWPPHLRHSRARVRLSTGYTEARGDSSDSRADQSPTALARLGFALCFVWLRVDVILFPTRPAPSITTSYLIQTSEKRHCFAILYTVLLTMSSRPHTPYSSVPQPDDQQFNRGYGTQHNTGVADFAQGNPTESSPLSQSFQQSRQGGLADEIDGSQHGSSALGEGINRSTSTASTAVPATAPTRSGTLKKKASISRKGSLKRSSSRKSLKAGSIKGVGSADGQTADFNNAFYTPIPTQGSPTEILANRFQGKCYSVIAMLCTVLTMP